MNRETVLDILRDMYEQCSSFGLGEIEFDKPFYDLCEEFDITIEEVKEGFE